MALEDILEKIMNLDENTCPCEIGIPCPFNQPTGYSHCATGDCVGGMASLIRSVVEE